MNVRTFIDLGIELSEPVSGMYSVKAQGDIGEVNHSPEVGDEVILNSSTMTESGLRIGRYAVSVAKINADGLCGEILRLNEHFSSKGEEQGAVSELWGLRVGDLVSFPIEAIQTLVKS